MRQMTELVERVLALGLVVRVLASGLVERVLASGLVWVARLRF